MKKYEICILTTIIENYVVEAENAMEASNAAKLRVDKTLESAEPYEVDGVEYLNGSCWITCDDVRELNPDEAV